MRATLTDDGCSYDGDTSPATGVFTVDVENRTSMVGAFALARISGNATGERTLCLLRDGTQDVRGDREAAEPSGVLLADRPGRGRGGGEQPAARRRPGRPVRARVLRGRPADVACDPRRDARRPRFVTRARAALLTRFRGSPTVNSPARCYPPSPHFTGLAKWARDAPIRFERTRFRWPRARTTGSASCTAAITPAVESTLPGVEVLAVELLSPARFCVYVDHPDGVDFALCERVTRLLDDYRAELDDRRLVARARAAGAPARAFSPGDRRHREAEDGRREAPSGDARRGRRPRRDRLGATARHTRSRSTRSSGAT